MTGKHVTGSASDAGTAALNRVRDHATRFPEAIAVSCHTSTGWSDMTWARLHRAAARVATAARRRLPPARPVIVVVDNTPECVATILGLAFAAVDIILVEHASSYLADDLSAIHRSEPCAIALARGSQVPALTPGLRTIRRFRFDELMAPALAPAPAAEAPSAGRPSESTVLQLTSGSTGEPRIARVPFATVLRGGLLYRDLYGLAAGDTIFAAVPLAHSFGFVGALAAAVVSGAGLKTLTRFTGHGLAEGLGDGASVLLATPFIYGLVPAVLHGRQPPWRLRTALSSGGPLSPGAATAAEKRLGRPIHQIYGSTETGLVACQYDRAEPWPRESVGVVAPGVDWRVESATDQEVGHLVVRTATMFQGYLEPSAGPFSADGFYDTGDLVRVDGAGHVFVVGRKATFVNVGGRKVNPRRLERLIGESTGVRDVFVCGVVTDRGDEEIHAVLELRTGTSVEQIVEFCRTRLAPYEIPHHVHAMDPLPRTALGKVDRREVLHAIAGQNVGTVDGG